ncbi:MAG: hypothetical protein ACO1N0_02470 [Fluviicola sp.]
MKALLFVLLSACSFSAAAQTGKQQTPIVYPVQQLLGIEYEIKNVPQPDNDRLLLIPYVQLISQRQSEVDVEIYDPASDYTIVLYSDTKCQQNKH